MTIEERFWDFYFRNPHVFETLERLATQWFEAGHDRCAIGMLWEVLRWETGIKTTSTDDYRLNDHYRSRYVRWLVRLHPEWIEAFEMRELRAA